LVACRWNIHARSAAAVTVLASAMSLVGSLARASDAGHYEASCSTSHREGGQIQIDAIDLPRRSSPHIVDMFTVCNADLDRCAVTNEAGAPYWHDAAGRLVIFHFTETIAKTKQRGRTLLETFPICGWTDGRGAESQYGGQCYVAVASNGQFTVSINYLLGQNVGKKNRNKYQDEVVKARHALFDVLDSARMINGESDCPKAAMRSR